VSQRLSAGGFVRGLAQLKGRRAAWAWASLTVLGLRVALGAVTGSVWLAIRSYIPAALRVDATLTGGHPYGPLAEAALAVWSRWDAMHYLNLARVGYFGASVGDSVFHPMYPLLVRLAALVTGGPSGRAGQPGARPSHPDCRGAGRRRLAAAAAVGGGDEPAQRRDHLA